MLNNLGGARVGLGAYRVAEYDLRRTIRWAEISGQGGWLSDTYRFLAEACLGQEVGSPAFIGGVWRTLGKVIAHAAEPVAIGDKTCNAEACFAESVRVFTEMGAEGERARTLRAWARYEMGQEAQDIFARLGMELEVERMSHPEGMRERET